jgi:hypothetical protein
MLFRYRRYEVVPGQIDGFNTFFREHLLPVQQHYGARLVGRWQTEDGAVVIALWAYDDLAHYEAIQAQVSRDPRSKQAQMIRREALDPLYSEQEELFLVPTLPLSMTELAHLGE